MTAFPVLAPGGAREIREFGIDRNNLYPGADDKEVELPSCTPTPAALDHHASFEDGCGRDEAAAGGDNALLNASRSGS